MGHKIRIVRDEKGYWQVWVDDKQLDRVTEVDVTADRRHGVRVTLHLDADMLEVDGTNAITYNLNER